MIRVFICPKCGETRMVSKVLKAACHRCGAVMSLCDVPYSKWVEFGADEREEISKRFLHREKDK